MMNHTIKTVANPAARAAESARASWRAVIDIAGGTQDH